MPDMLELRKATQEDIDAILHTVRQENIAELEVLGVGVDYSLVWSLENSSEACVAVIDGEVVAGADLPRMEKLLEAKKP